MRFLMGPKTSNADKFDLHVHVDIMKIEKNRNCVSCLGGEHGFEKQFFDANSYQVPPSIVIQSLRAFRRAGDYENGFWLKTHVLR